VDDDAIVVNFNKKRQLLISYKLQQVQRLYSGGAYVTNLGSRKNFMLIFGHCYRCVLTIDRKWKIDVAIFSV